MNNLITEFFDTWIIKQHNSLKQRIIHAMFFSEDDFQETYLMMRDTLIENDSTADFEVLFIALYKQALSHEYNHAMRFFHPDPLFFIYMQPETEEAGNEEEQTPSADIQVKQIDAYVRRTYKDQDYQLFHLSLFDAMSWKGLMGYTGLSASTISRRLNKVKAEVCQYFNQVRIKLESNNNKLKNNRSMKLIIYGKDSAPYSSMRLGFRSMTVRRTGTFVFTQKARIELKIKNGQKAFLAQADGSGNDWYICFACSGNGFNIRTRSISKLAKSPKEELLFSNRFTANKLLDIVKAENSATFLISDKPMDIDGGEWYKIVVSKPLRLK